jgi:hypothetical protein
MRPILALLTLALTLAVPAGAEATHSVGTPAQIAWVRRSATNFIDAELQGDGATACGVLNAPLRATRSHRSCAQRWDEKLAAMRRDPATHAQLRSDRRAIATAAIVIHGDSATVELPDPLLGGSSHFVWSENCWMLTG